MSQTTKPSINNAEALLKVASRLPRDELLSWLEKQNQPRYLYKYQPFTTPSYAEDIVCKSQLHLNSVDKFNDPFELQWKTTVSENLDDRIRKFTELGLEHADLFPSDPYQKNLQILAKALDTETTKKTADLLNSTRQNKHGVISFSEDPYSILMWAHYANNHEGCVFEFEVVDDIEVFASTVSVNYSDDYPVVEWTDRENTSLKSAFFTKYSQWGYEKERRIFRLDKANTTLPFKPQALSRIFTGCRFTKESMGLLQSMLDKRQINGWRHPQVIGMAIDKESYKLNPI